MNLAHTSKPPVLDVSHLEMLRAIDEHGRLSVAAAALNVTPSALSHRIREAERRLGIPLYERTHRRLEPTAAARYLADTAGRTLDELARAEADSRRMTGAVRRVVRGGLAGRAASRGRQLQPRARPGGRGARPQVR